jgi:hypothetical protein
MRLLLNWIEVMHIDGPQFGLRIVVQDPGLICREPKVKTRLFVLRYLAQYRFHELCSSVLRISRQGLSDLSHMPSVNRREMNVLLHNIVKNNWRNLVRSSSSGQNVAEIHCPQMCLLVPQVDRHETGAILTITFLSDVDDLLKLRAPFSSEICRGSLVQ